MLPIRDERGVYLGEGVHMDKKSNTRSIFLSDEHRKRGTFVFGTTGVGKTRLEEMLACDDINTGKSTIIFDPKSDQGLFSTIYDCCDRNKCLHELQLISSIFPEHSASIDPMSYFYDPEELISHATSGIQAGKDPFFAQASRLFVTPLVYAHLLLCKRANEPPKVTLHTLYNSLKRNEQTSLRDSLEKLPESFRSATDTEFYQSMLQSNLDKPDDYYEKLTTTLQANLVPLIAGNIGKIIGKADSNLLIQRLEQGKRVIAVVHTGTMVSPNSAAILGRVLLSMIKSTIGRHYISKREKMNPALSLHIDEAHSVITNDTLQVLAMAGSANVMTHLYTQSVNQIHAALGDEKLGKSALDTTNTKIFMKCTDAETAQYVIPHFGVHDVLSAVFNGDQVTTRQVEKDILTERNLLDLKPRECFMMTQEGRFAFTTKNSTPSRIKIVFPDVSAGAISPEAHPVTAVAAPADIIVSATEVPKPTPVAQAATV